MYLSVYVLATYTSFPKMRYYFYFRGYFCEDLDLLVVFFVEGEVVLVVFSDLEEASRFFMI